jgi:hypothetical protein
VKIFSVNNFLSNFGKAFIFHIFAHLVKAIFVSTLCKSLRRCRIRVVAGRSGRVRGMKFCVLMVYAEPISTPQRS